MTQTISTFPEIPCENCLRFNFETMYCAHLSHRIANGQAMIHHSKSCLGYIGKATPKRKSR